MTLTKPAATMRIAREIGDAEQALNDALIKQSQLLSTLVAARRDLADSQLTGQDALLRLVKAQQSLLTSGNDLARVHGRLLDINREMGGGAMDCPDNWRQIGLANDAMVA